MVKFILLFHSIFILFLFLDNTFMKIFLLTYQSFATPYILFEKLKQRYNSPENIGEGRIINIRLLICIVLKHWIETQIDDFDDDLLIQVRHFINLLSTQEKVKSVAINLQKYLQDQVEERNLRTQLWFQEPEIILVPEEGMCLSDFFMEVPPKSIAAQLTLIDFEIYRSIDVIFYFFIIC
jgi:hypothetical protein